MDKNGKDELRVMLVKVIELYVKTRKREIVNSLKNATEEQTKGLLDEAKELDTLLRTPEKLFKLAN